MPRMAIFALGIVIALSVGCFFNKQDVLETIEGQSRFSPLNMKRDTLLLQSTLIDQPLGTPFLEHDVWLATTSPLSHRDEAMFERNGLRLGVLSGIIPSEFERLISAEESTLNPMMRTLPPNSAKVIPIVGPLPECEFTAANTLFETAETFHYEDVEAGLSIVGEPLNLDRIRLYCELRLQHGDKQSYLEPSDDGSRFTKTNRKPLHDFPTLKWTVDLDRNDFLILGPTVNPANSIGGTLFFDETPGRVRHHILVLRAGMGASPIQQTDIASMAASSVDE